MASLFSCKTCSRELTFIYSYENVLWDEFGNFVKPSSQKSNRTPPQPDLTYAFLIQTSTSYSLKGFARDELAQSLSLQSLMKLVEQGITCAPTSTLGKATALGCRTNWSSSDRSCFPWAIVEIEKDVSVLEYDAIERCYCRAANAASAALDLQAQVFNEFQQSCSLQPPPVVAFTCVGPIVKVWLAYQDKSRVSAIPIQVRIAYRNSCQTLTNNSAWCASGQHRYN
jgi:hypothetical protein